MNQEFQWGITTALTLLGLFAGRYWRLLDRLREHDEKIFKAVVEELPSNGTILFVRRQDFGSSFEVEKLRELDNFIEFSLRPENHFIDRKLEKLRLLLVKDVDIFNDYLSMHTWPISSTGEERRNKMKMPEEFSSFEKYQNEKGRINALADQVCNHYDSLIKTAAKKGFYM